MSFLAIVCECIWIGELTWIGSMQWLSNTSTAARKAGRIGEPT